MTVRRKRFELDRAEGKLFGVCAGLARHTGIDATILRVAVVIVTLMGGWPWTVIAYLAAAFVGHKRRNGPSPYQRLGDPDSSRERMRALDLRMQAIETYVTSSNSRLAREIEDLR